MSVGLSKVDQTTDVELRSMKLPDSSSDAIEMSRPAVPEDQTRAPEPFTRRRSPEGSNCREAPESAAPDSPPATQTGMLSYVTAARKAESAVGMKPREKVPLGENQELLRVAAEREEPGEMSAEREREMREIRMSMRN